MPIDIEEVKNLEDTLTIRSKIIRLLKVEAYRPSELASALRIQIVQVSTSLHDINSHQERLENFTLQKRKVGKAAYYWLEKK